LVTLRWNPSKSSGIVGYYVYRGTESGGPYSKVNSSAIAGTQYTDTSVQPGHTYYYVVRSVESNGVQSTDSDQVSANIPTP
jgi:fibronectin type 3 domain-containing protein